jgi:glycosyltransferase involved in cell wall biosynthesis
MSSVDVRRREFVQFVAIGRLTQQKGIDLLLAAMALARARTSIPVKLVVAGEGEDRAALAYQSTQLALDDCVSFLGRVSDIRQVLLDADAFVMPSRWEGFPNAMIEAMALGVPVIVARCPGGIEDILGESNDPCGLEFSPGDVAALADRIVQCAEDPALRVLLGSRARVRAADYSPACIAACWRDVVSH